MESEISIIPHTEKSFVVFTNKHIKYMTSLKNLGGIFDANLFDKETGKKFMGWIFYMDKKDTILNWINNGCQPINKIIFEHNNDNRSLFEKRNSSDCKSETKITKSNVSMLENLEKRIQSLIEKQIQNSFESINLKIDMIEEEMKQISRKIILIEEQNLKSNKKESKEDEEYEILF